MGIFLREFTHGHTRQLAAVLRRHLVALAARTPVLAGIDQRAFIDIDSLLRPVYGHAKQGASFGHTKIAGKASCAAACPPGGHDLPPRRRRRCSPESGCGPDAPDRRKARRRMLTEAINTAIEPPAPTRPTSWSAATPHTGNGKVVAAVVKAGARFSFAIARNPAVDAAIATIGDDAYIPVHYPGAVIDPDTGQLISDAQVAEVQYTAFAGTRYATTARLIVRRVLDANTQDPLFPVWRHHPFFTNSPEPTAQADITHRRHAICETVWSDLIDGPWAHQPSGSFAANTAWCILAAICHNLLRAAGTLTATHRYTVARGATLRTPPHRRPSPTRPTPTPTGAAPTRALAASRRLAHPLAGDLHHLNTPPRACNTRSAPRPR